MIRTSTLLWFARANGVPSDDVIADLARYDDVWLFQWTDTRATLGGELDLSWSDAIKARVKAMSLKTRVGLYAGPIANAPEIFPSYGWFSDAELFHGPAGAPLIYDDVVNDWHYRWPNLLDAAVRAKLIDRYIQLCLAHSYDGVMLDQFTPIFFAQLIREPPATGGWFGLNGGIEEGWRMDQEGWWVNTLGLLADQMRWRFEQHGLSLYLVGMSPYPNWSALNPTDVWQGVGGSNMVDHASGAIMERPVECYSSPRQLTDQFAITKLATDKRRGVMWYAAPWFFDQHWPTQDSPGMQRYMLAAYLLIQEVPYTSFGYAPEIPYRGWAGPNWYGPGTPAVFWSADWGRDYGVPLQSYQMAADAQGMVRLAWRSYTRSRSATDYVLVVVNPTDAPQLTTFGGTWRVWDPDVGPIVSAPLTVPAKTGWVLWQQL